MEFNNLSFTNDIKDKDQNEINEQIDIYIKQRNGRKCITIIQGLINDKDLLKSYAKAFRKLLSCSCTVDTDKESGDYFLKLSGKESDKIVTYLVNNLQINKSNSMIIRAHMV